MTEGDTVTATAELDSAIARGFEDDDAYHVVWSGSAAMWLGDEERAGALYATGAALARARGSVGVLAPALGLLSLQLFIAQRFDEAGVSATEAEQMAREAGAENLIALPLFVRAAVAAIRGLDDEAQRLVSDTIALASAQGLLLAAARPVWALALLDLGRGRWEDALARLETVSGARMGLAGVMAMRTIPDRIEAAVRAGRPEAARLSLAAFERWAERVNRPSAWSRLASCRGLLTEGEIATRHFERALELSADALPFDLARMHLLFGEHLRRERAEATRGCTYAWHSMALSGCAPSRGRAALLFLSPRTIDSHLRNVFSKLSISSRTQLARLPLDDGAPPAAASHAPGGEPHQRAARAPPRSPQIPRGRSVA